MALSDAYARALGRLGAATLESLQAFEAAQRRLHPPWLPELRERLGPRHERLAGALAAWRATQPAAELAAFHEQLAEGAAHAEADEIQATSVLRILLVAGLISLRKGE